MPEIITNNYDKILNWFFFNTVLSMLSVPLVMFAAWMTNKGKKLFTIIRDGQLCFYCTTTIATFLNDANNKGITSNFIMLSIFIFLLSSFVYGIAAVYGDHDDKNLEWKMGWTSIGCAATTTILIIAARLNNGML
jgi:hypothetical protein